MGPNLYQSPPGGFTHFHQDGQGTVDSGHLCLEGYNEVVMLRRMNDAHMDRALAILNCNPSQKLGHAHNEGKKPLWPDHQAIKNCKKSK
jgi:hypothetical protein